MIRTATRPLLTFVMLSGIAHGALLLAMRAASEPPPGPDGTELQVSLPLPPFQGTGQRPSSDAADNYLAAAPSTPASVINGAPAMTENNPASPNAGADALASASSDSRDASNAAESRSQQVRRVLWRALGASFRYPLVAQRNGWQGEVRLALVVGTRGQLSDIRIVQSSGYEILDDAAVEALHQLRRIPEAVALLNGASLTLVLPVRYRLVRS